MQPATPAAFDISLSPDPAGANAPVILRFDDSSTHLFVERYQQLDPPDWWLHYALDVSGYGFLALAILFIFILLRILRRPQLLGHLHCRRCNYDLTHLDQPTPALCPECGTSTAAHRPRAGSATSRRLLVPLGTLLPLLSLAALTFAHFCESPRPGNIAWPFDAARRIVPFWPFARIPAPSTMGLKVFVYPLSASTSDRTPRPFELSRLGGELPVSSPDGNILAWCQFDQWNDWKIEAIFADLTTGRTRTVSLGTNADGFPKVQGFTADGREALFTLSGLVGTPAEDPNAPSAPISVRLLAVAADTGAVRTIGTAPSIALRGGASSWNVPQVLAAMHNDGSWAMLARHANVTGNIVLAPAGVSPADIPLGMWRGDINDGLLHFIAPTTVATEKYTIDTTTGTVTARPPTQIAWSALGTGTASPLTRDGTPTGIVLDLAVANGSVDASQVQVSPDGRWAAAQVFAPVTNRIDTVGVRVWVLPQARGIEPQPGIP